MPGEQKMTDAEIVCAWMEPKPIGGKPGPHGSNEVWWRWGWRYVGPSLPQQETPVEYCWLPRLLTLNECHLVQAKLSDEQWPVYRSLIQDAAPSDDWRWSRILLHADAPTKIRALASVLRPVVEGK